MATTTLGTAGTTTLTAIQWQPAGVSASDLTAIRNAILNDQIIGLPNPVYPGALENGKLYVPNRGVLTILPGDWIGVDANGWPVLIPGSYIANPSGIAATGSITTGTSIVTNLSVGASTMGWTAGMVIASTAGITSGTQIASIVAGGSSITLTQNALANSAAATLTIGGGWIHP